MSAPTPLAALVLAGERPRGDPFAREQGVASKAAIPLDGRPMLLHVLDALRAVPTVGRIAVAASNDLGVPLPDGIERLTAAPSGPSRSVAGAVAHFGDGPLLVTTADHPLLKPEWIARFLADVPADADAAAALAPRTAVERDAGATRRTYLRFADGAWSGCNLFWFAGARALPVLHFWERAEADRKRPWRLLATIGPGLVIDRLLGRLTLYRALDRLGARTGTRLRAVELPFGEAAVDVDKPADLALARAILAARRTGG